MAFYVGVVGRADRLSFSSDPQDHVGEVSIPPSFSWVIVVLDRRKHCFLGALINGVDDVFGEHVQEVGGGGVRKVFG